jgi:hypothetical protein
MKGKKTGGRQKGTPNKITANLKDAVLNAFSQVGGENYLVKVAQDNPQVFCGLLGKVLPTQVTGDGGGPVRLIVETGVPRDGTD